MSWGSELFKIRRLLRDPDANIWSDAFLRHLNNDVQKDFQNRTLVLEEVNVQRVPGLYHFAYMHDWEYRHLPRNVTQYYQCLHQHSGAVICHRWEPQVVTGAGTDVTDYGVHFTQPWEAFMGQTPGERIRNKFPLNMRNLKFIAYDEEPIGTLTEKKIQNADASYLTNEGRPFAYYETDDVDGSYVLYPRPSTSFVDEIEGEGVAMFATDDTEDVTTGTIAVRTGDGSIGEGVAVDIVGTIDNVLMVYDVSPTDAASISDEGDYPAFLQKYIKYGVVARAYGANTDGKIPSLSEYWGIRYSAGVKTVKRFVRNKRNDRDYQLISGRTPARNQRHPKLPPEYPEP